MLSSNAKVSIIAVCSDDQISPRSIIYAPCNFVKEGCMNPSVLPSMYKWLLEATSTEATILIVTLVN